MAVRSESLIFRIFKYFSMISGNAVCARIIDEFKMHEYFQLSKPKHYRMNINQWILSLYFLQRATFLRDLSVSSGCRPHQVF